MTWHRYLDLLAVMLLCSLVFATYRDAVDGEYDSWFGYISRFAVCSCLAFGLRKRNVWTVRAVYAFAIFCLVVFIGGSLAFGLPLSLGEMAALTCFILPFSFAVFVPRDSLRPVLTAVGTSPDSSNPYSPLSAELTDTANGGKKEKGTE